MDLTRNGFGTDAPFRRAETVSIRQAFDLHTEKWRWAVGYHAVHWTINWVFKPEADKFSSPITDPEEVDSCAIKRISGIAKDRDQDAKGGNRAPPPIPAQTPAKPLAWVTLNQSLPTKPDSGFSNNLLISPQLPNPEAELS